MRVPNGVVAELQVLMQRFLPTLPCISPQTAAEKLKCVDGASMEVRMLGTRMQIAVSWTDDGAIASVFWNIELFVRV